MITKKKKFDWMPALFVLAYLGSMSASLLGGTYLSHKYIPCNCSQGVFEMNCTCFGQILVPISFAISSYIICYCCFSFNFGVYKPS
jgi:hypothetical protein